MGFFFFSFLSSFSSFGASVQRPFSGQDFHKSTVPPIMCDYKMEPLPWLLYRFLKTNTPQLKELLYAILYVLPISTPSLARKAHLINFLSIRQMLH